MEKSTEDLSRDLALLEERITELKRQLELKKREEANKIEKLTLKHRTKISDITEQTDRGLSLVGQTFLVAGWCKSVRLAQKDTLGFIQLADGTTHKPLQILVSKNDVVDECWDLVYNTLHQDTSVQIIGELVVSPARGVQVELIAKNIVLLGECPNTYPLTSRHVTLEYLRTVGHLRPRTNTIGSVARVRNSLSIATHQYFQSLNFIHVHSPIITTTYNECSSEMFSVTSLLSDKGKSINPPMTKEGNIDYSKDFFKRPAFLSTSGQFNNEMYACAMSQIYSFGPAFKAELAQHSRKLAEYWLVEPEIAFADLEEAMDLVESYVKYVLIHVLENCTEDIAFFGEAEKKRMKQYNDNYNGEDSLRERLNVTLNEPFARVTYTEVIDMLQKSDFKFYSFIPKWGDDLGFEHQRYIVDKVYKRPIIVTNYPKHLKPFYMRVNEDDKTVASMDVWLPCGVELASGSQREERLAVLEKSMRERGVQTEEYESYLELRRYGTVPHAGFSLGFERLVLFVTGLENIRDAIPFPRYPEHADF